MSILRLPTEVLQLIAYCLESESSIKALYQTCHCTNNLLLGYLYWHNATYHNSSGLLWAAKYGKDSAIRKMLQVGVDLETTNINKETPLSLSAWNGHENVVTLLLHAELINKYTKDRHGRTPLFIGARNGHIAVVKALMLNLRRTVAGHRYLGHLAAVRLG